MVALLLSVCLGCSKKEDTAAPTTEETFSLPDLTSDTLQVGYGRADITPKDCVPLRGYNNSSERQSFSNGTGEILADKYVAMLKYLYEIRD